MVTGQRSVDVRLQAAEVKKCGELCPADRELTQRHAIRVTLLLMTRRLSVPAPVTVSRSIHFGLAHDLSAEASKMTPIEDRNHFRNLLDSFDTALLVTHGRGRSL
ncbi:MAG: hypothetical protein KDA77_21585, partial [Planctomycetaceae bacterium]|nr:hypothetical protein [Planctomycetaceae bacterium]